MIFLLATSRRTATHPSFSALTGVALILAVLLLGSSGCASTASSLRPSSKPADVAGGAGTEPWQLPAESFPTQRLFRLTYDGPEGDLDFKLTLYLTSPSQYRLQAVFGLGRKLWDLDIDASDRVLWVDHREKTFCHAGDAGRLVIVPVAQLPLASLPLLLLGRLPTPPASELARNADHLSFRDLQGQKWSAGFAPAGDGMLEWWSLELEGKPAAWWRGEPGKGVFSDRRGQQQLRWQQVVVEPLALAVAALEPPARYREVSCEG